MSTEKKIQKIGSLFLFFCKFTLFFPKTRLFGCISAQHVHMILYANAKKMSSEKNSFVDFSSIGRPFPFCRKSPCFAKTDPHIPPAAGKTVEERR